jgi:ABC-type phosphate transport system permease subunit
MNDLNGIIAYLIGSCLMLVSLFNIMLPIFDWLPRAIYLSLYKKEIKIRATFICIINPIIWAIVLAVISMLLFIFIPFLDRQSVYKGSFFYGELGGILLYLCIILTNYSKIRRLLDERFEFIIAPYRKKRILKVPKDKIFSKEKN